MPIALRTDFDASALRREARRAKDAGQARRLLALAAIYDGATRTEAASVNFGFKVGLAEFEKSKRYGK